MAVRRWLLSVLCATLCAVLCLLSHPAMAAEGLTMSISADPSSMYQPGTAQITVVVGNPTTQQATNLHLQVNGTSVSLPATLEAGVSTSVQVPVTLDWSNLSCPLPVTLAWELDGKVYSNASTVTVERIPSDPHLTFLRTADKTEVLRGENVAVTYTVTNSGHIDTDAVTIKDPELGVTLNIGSLKPGESKAHTETLHMTRSLVSTPTVTCDAAQSNYTFLPSTETLRLTVLHPALTVKLEASSPEITEGDPITLVLTVTNSGDVAFRDLSITEPTLGSPFEGGSLEAGATRTYSQKVVPSGSSASYRFTIKGDVEGKAYSYTSNGVSVTINAADTPAMLTLYASSEVLRITEPGEVQIALLLENTGIETLTGVSVHEENLGLIRSFDQLPTGQNSFSCNVKVDETKSFRFYAQVVDGDTARNFYSESVTVEYAPTATPTPAPIATVVPTAGRSPINILPTKEDSRTPLRHVQPMMILILVLLLLAGLAATIGLVVYSVRLNRRSKRKRRKQDLRRAPVRTASYTTSVSRTDSPSVAALREGRVGAASGDTLQFRRIIVPNDPEPTEGTRVFSPIPDLNHEKEDAE